MGLRLHDSNTKNPVTTTEINKYLDTKGIITAETLAVNGEYQSQMTDAQLKGLMQYAENESIAVSKLPKNVYAECAYAKGGQNGMAALPPEAGIVGPTKPFTNDIICGNLIRKQEVVPEALKSK